MCCLKNTLRWRKDVTINISHSREFWCPLECIWRGTSIFAALQIRLKESPSSQGEESPGRGKQSIHHLITEAAEMEKKPCYWQDAVNLPGLKPVLNHRKRREPVTKTIRISLGWNKESTRYSVVTSFGDQFWIFVIVTVWFWSLCCLNLYHVVWTHDPTWGKNPSPLHGRLM